MAFTTDFYSRLHPSVSRQRLVWIGRVATTIMVLIGLAWIRVIREGRGVYDYNPFFQQLSPTS